MAEDKPIRGTREWAVAALDCCTGCPHDCRYCYGRFDQVERHKTLTAKEWRICRIHEDDVERVWPLYPGQVMFPTTHDILPENLAACMRVIGGLLSAGNRVLVVTKPHLACIEELCRAFTGYRERLLFRFTITARDPALLSFWEPGAPRYPERKASLSHAHGAGFATSVSVEPMLDTGDVVAMVRELLPWVTHSIWLGKMNRIAERVAVDGAEAEEAVRKIHEGQSDDKIRDLYRQLRDEPLLRWKESIKQVLGLPLAQQAGEDR